MKQHVVALFGISGVGKSTLLREISDLVAFQHLEASALIRKGREAAGARDISTDTLRQLNIGENQQLLISEFRRCQCRS
jgi:adenylate kinase